MMSRNCLPIIRQARDTHDHHVATSQDRSDEVLYHVLVSDDFATDLLDEGFSRYGKFLQQLEIPIVSRARWARLGRQRSPE